MDRVASIHMTLPGAAAGVAPDWIMFIPAGTFTGVDGRGPYRLSDPEAVIAASLRGDQQLALDENHSTDLAGQHGGEAPARGWIVELQAREGAIWGRVEWTPVGRQLMADRAYRGVSPVFQTDAKGVVTTLLRAALTNNPNLSQLPKLQSEGRTMDLAAMRKALGLPDTADEGAILAAAAAATSALAAHAAHLQSIATAAGADKAEPDAIVAVLNAVRSKAGGVDKLASELVALQTQLGTLRTERARDAATAFVDGQIKAGKPISGALRDHYVARHMADPAAVETELGAMVSLHAGGMKGGKMVKADAEDGDGEMMSAEDMEVCRKMGVDPKAMAKQRKADRERAASVGADGSMT